MAREMIIFAVPDVICLLCLTILWVDCDEAGEGIRKGRQGLVVDKVGVWEDGICRQLHKVQA